MKILLARMNHETNTFSPVPTPLKSFGDDGPLYGQAAYEASKGTRTGIAAFIDLVEQAGHEVVVAISATANPSDRVAAQAYTHIADTIVAAAAGCDAVMLDLHGAMVAENTDDGEGTLLARVRAALPHAPIAVALDLHGKMTPEIANNADVVVSFKTYPHIDMYETGEHAGRLLLDMIAGRTKPVIAWRRLPLMVHTLRSRTDIGAMHEAVQMAKTNAIEKSLKGQKKTAFADGCMAGMAGAPRVPSPLQRMAMMQRAKSVPVAPAGPMIAPGMSPDSRVGVGQMRPGSKPDIGAIRAAMARAATRANPDMAPSAMKKGGKVKMDNC